MEPAADTQAPDARPRAQGILDRLTANIDAFIHQVQSRLRIKYALPFVIGIALLIGSYFLLEVLIDQFRMPVGIYVPFVTLLILLAFVVNAYAILTRNLASTEAACLLIDEEVRTDWRTSFAAYYEGKQHSPPLPGWTQQVKSLHWHLREHDYDPRELVPLWSHRFWKWLFFGLLAALLFWLASLFLLSLPGPSATNTPTSDQPSQLESYARQVRDEATHESTRDVAGDVEEAAQGMRQGGDAGTHSQTLSDLRDQVQQEIDHLGGEQLNEALDQAANRLSENPPTAPAGHKMFRRNLQGTAQELLDLQQQTAQENRPDDALAESLRHAADALDASPLEDVGRQLDAMADAVENNAPMNQQQREAFEQAFREAQQRVDDQTRAQRLQEHLDTAMRQLEREARSNDQLAQSAEALQEQLDQQALQLKDLGDQGDDLADRLRRLNKEFKRGLLSADEMMQRLDEIEADLLVAIQQADDADEQGQLQSVLDALLAQQEQFEDNLFDHVDALSERGRLGDVTLDDDFELKAEPDNAAPAAAPTTTTGRRQVHPDQAADSRVARPQHSPNDQELLKAFYDRQHR